ncbi:hypothetical protein L1S16_21175, partial [Klebsiella pneumoniae]
EGELMAHDVPLGCAPDEYDDLISGTCSHLPYLFSIFTMNEYGRKRCFRGWRYYSDVINNRADMSTR